MRMKKVMRIKFSLFIVLFVLVKLLIESKWPCIPFRTDNSFLRECVEFPFHMIIEIPMGILGVRPPRSAFGIYILFAAVAFVQSISILGIFVLLCRLFRNREIKEQCSSCGYSTKGLTGSRCPECGQEISFLHTENSLREDDFIQ